MAGKLFHNEGTSSVVILWCRFLFTFLKTPPSAQVMEDGMCRLVATLPQLDEQKCPDMFRCTDEVSYWLSENEERKQQIVTLKETISELQEELRNHRHRIKVLELQVTLYLLT